MCQKPTDDITVGVKVQQDVETIGAYTVIETMRLESLISKLLGRLHVNIF